MEEIKELEEMTKDILDDLKDLNQDIEKLRNYLGDPKWVFSDELKAFQDSSEENKLNSLIFFREIPFCYRLRLSLNKEVFNWLLLFNRVDKNLKRFQAFRERLLKEKHRKEEEQHIRILRERSRDFKLAMIEKLRNYETGMKIYSFGTSKIAFDQLFKGLNEEEYLKLWILIHSLKHYGDLDIKKIDDKEFVVLNMNLDEINKEFLKCKKQKEEFKEIANSMEILLKDDD
ncbi:MAG: hypothetical protein ACFFDB_00475 [Promethearchaeota archaeon]